MREYNENETISWMSTLEKRVSSASVALFTKSGQVLVVKASYKKYWSFPGGVIDAGETPRMAAVRETREEVGLLLEIEQVVFKLIVDRLSRLAQTYQFVFEQEVAPEFLKGVTIDNIEIEAYDIVTREQILESEREYSESVIRWARGQVGYFEQSFGN